VERLNYHHLRYFWTVVRTGSIAEAGKELDLSSPTISTQLRRLEEELGEHLLEKSGRRVVPTEMGRLVFRYAEEIFRTGREMLDAIELKPSGRPLRLAIGVDDILPKEIVHALVQPALHLAEPVRLVFREALLQRLLADLTLHDLDVVLSDAPVTPTVDGRLYNHHLGECGVVWMAVPELARGLRPGFPRSLAGSPIVLPTNDTAIRRALDLWFDRRGLRPSVQAEFEDFALMSVFAQRGMGALPVPSVLESQFRLGHGLERVGVADRVRHQFFAISVERRLRHPAVVALSAAARKVLSSGAAPSPRSPLRGKRT
jgi:LysR family transcriptional activator of nhaA